MDGLEATRHVRERERDSAKHTRIIALTGDGIECNRETCRAAGMDDFLAKPLEMGNLSRMMDRWVGQHKEPEPERLPQPPSYRLLAGFDPVNERVLDWTVLESIHALQQPGQPELVKEVVTIYLEESPRLMDNLRKAVQHGDYEEIRHIAHSLKSSSAHIGARALAELALDLELLVGNRSAENADKQLALIERACSDVVHELERIMPNATA